HGRLSAAFSSRPVSLSRVDGHALFANAEALRRAGIDRNTPDPAGGRIVRDEEGEPTGVLVDAAMEILRRAIPPLTDGDRERLVLDALCACSETGLTAVHDAGMDAATLAVVERLDADGRLPLRVYAMVEGSDEAALSRWLARGPHHGNRLTVRAVKLYLDGALGSRGARFCEPYDDDPSNRGLELLPAERLQELLPRIDRAGFQVAMHAIGDAANALALDSLVACGIGRASRPRIEHAQVMRLSDLPRLAAIGAIASMQPAHCTSDMAWLPSRIGARRLPGASAWRTLLEAGVPLAFGSDFPIEPPDPRKGLYAALTRQDEEGRPPGGFFPEERLGVLEALRAYTQGGAFASFEEERAGRIAAGMRADFTVLGADPRAALHRGILDAPLLATIVGGELVVDRLRSIYDPLPGDRS
ncbi:MAG TPA: amidohydrolase, partial [Vulgatibacter sp.]